MSKHLIIISDFFKIKTRIIWYIPTKKINTLLFYLEAMILIISLSLKFFYVILEMNKKCW